MTESQLEAIEAQVSLKLPSHYRNFLRDYPKRLIESKLNLSWCQEAPAERQLLNDAHKIVELNSHVRLPGTPWVGEAGDPWPEHYFVIGNDGCGNYWCLDLSAADEGVWFYDHDLGEFERQHDNLREFADALLAHIAEFNQHDAPVA